MPTWRKPTLWGLCLLGAIGWAGLTGSPGAGLAVFGGAGLLGLVTLGVEVLTNRLVDRSPAQTEVRHGVRIDEPAGDGASGTEARAGVVLLLGASRFWLATLALVVLTIALDNVWVGPAIGGFVLATMLDAGARLRQVSSDR